jgi:hypothetical protein
MNITAPTINISDVDPTGQSVVFTFGDINHETIKSGPIVSGTVSVGGLQMGGQLLAAISATNDSLAQNGISGIFGVGFPGPVSSDIVGNIIKQALGPAFPEIRANKSTEITDITLALIPTAGPLLPRMVINGLLDQPMFVVRSFLLSSNGCHLTVLYPGDS